MRQLRLFLHAFCISFFIFSLMIMGSVLWVNPFSSGNTNQPENISIPSANEQLDLLLIYEDVAASLISFQPQTGIILLETLPLPDEDVSQLSVYYNVEIDNVIFLSDFAIQELIDCIGGVSIAIEQELTMQNSGLHMYLEPGMHSLNGEQSVQYLHSNSKKAFSHYQLVLISFMERILPMITGDNFQQLFAQIVDCTETDLTLNDYDHYHWAINFMMLVVENPLQITERLPEQPFLYN